MIHEQIDPMIVEEDEVLSRVDEFESFDEFAREMVRQLAHRLRMPAPPPMQKEDEP